MIAFKCCSRQYIISATDFKERFRIHKGDFSTGKIRCGVASHLLNFVNLPHVKPKLCKYNLLKMLMRFYGKEKKYWETQLFTLTHGLNDMNQWYALNR